MLCSNGGSTRRAIPGQGPQILAYLRRIVRAARNFQGAAWVAYDRLYRRQALAQRSLDWAKEDSSLYNEAFVGQAKAISRCRHCLSDFHPTEACPELTQFLPPWFGPYPQALAPPTYMGHAIGNGSEICRKFNQGRCFMQRCKYMHTCSNCGHPHPATLCRNGPGAPPELGPVVGSGLHHYSPKAGSHDLWANAVRPKGPLSTE